MPNDRNKLKGGVQSLLRRTEAPAVEEVTLVKRSGRPPKDQPSGWNSNRDYRTSIVMDREQHNTIKKLANSTGVTFKQVMYLLLEEGLTRYESGKLTIKNPLV